ncbi:short chain dehydrogenase [Xylariaceae sp. FL0804]|nr:short chain dehydrogenase [Xylariaceae sp. FL0804]
MDTSGVFRVDGMVAVVTGGGSGIGLTMARALAGAGAEKVYILGRRREVLEEAAAAAAADAAPHTGTHHPAGVLVPLVCDVTSKASLRAAADAVAADAGRVNLLIANSGVAGPEARWAPDLSAAELRRRLFDDVSMDEFTQTQHVNVTGAYFTLLAFLELLDAGNRHALLPRQQQQEAGEGGGDGGSSSTSGAPSRFGAPLAGGAADVPAVQSQVLFTSSISAFSRAHLSAPAYAASKAALVHLAKHAATNMARLGIRANALAPGIFPSDMTRDGMIGARDPSREAPDETRFIPARRFGGDEEMAGTVLYLASRAGAFCNGLVMLIDGGKLCTIPSEY